LVALVVLVVGLLGSAGSAGSAGPAGSAGSAGPAGSAGSAGPAGSAGSASGAVVARYGFDAAPGADDSGHGHLLRAVGAGQLTWVPHGAGHAIGFPACCAPVGLEAAS